MFFISFLSFIYKIAYQKELRTKTFIVEATILWNKQNQEKPIYVRASLPGGRVFSRLALHMQFQLPFTSYQLLRSTWLFVYL